MASSEASPKLVKKFPKRKSFRPSYLWFSELYNHSSVGVFISTITEGRVLDVNDSFLEMVGLSREELIGRTTVEIGLWESSELRRQTVRETEQKEPRNIFETQYKDKIGKKRHYLVHFEKITFNRIPCYLSLHYDITWIKWLEHAYYTFFENSLQGIIIYQDHHLVYVNTRLANIFGYSAEEMQAFSSEKLKKFIPPEDVGRMAALHQSVRDRSEPIHYEQRFFRKDGSICWLEVFCSNILYRNKPAYYLGVVDITERKMAEQALLENEKRFRSLYENAYDAILIDDQNTIIKNINLSGMRVLGYDSPEEVIGRKSDELVAEEDLPRVRRMFRCFINGTEDPCQPVEYRVKRKDGTLVSVESTVSILTSPSGDFAGTVVITRDIQERKQAEQKMRFLSRRLAEVEESERRLLAQELHDRVGQNLTAINISLNVINSQLASQPTSVLRERLNDSMGLVSETMERIRNVMGELHPPALEDYGIMAALRSFSSQFERRTGIQVDVQGTEPEPRLSGAVEIALFRIAQEALNNVLKHAQADQATIRLETQKNKIRFTIQDDGVGFNPSQARSFTARPAWGMVTMKERAEAVGGELSVESSPGAGTCLIVEILRR